jgi:hypothetical protein
MPRRCDPVRMPDGSIALVMRETRDPACQFCGARGADRLCDFQIEAHETCDARMCRRCASPVLGNPKLDYCPNHKGGQ